MYGRRLHRNGRLRRMQRNEAVTAPVDHFPPQVVLGALLGLTVVAALVVELTLRQPILGSRADAALLFLLTGAVAGSRLWPIRIGKSTRIYVASIPLYLVTCVFVPPVAALAVGIGMLSREVSVCRACKNAAGSISAQVGRWMLLAFGVSAMVHGFPQAYEGFGLMLAAPLLWIGDVLTCPLVFTPATGVRPAKVMAMAARQSYAGELMQYFIAMLTLLLFRTGILWTGVLWVDVLSLLLIVAPVILLYLYLKGEDALEREAPPLVPTYGRE
jgi:hypothetical protein